MARFKNKDIRLGVNEEVLFGDAQEASIKYDGSDLVTDHVLRHSTQGYFATQEFVDDALSGLEWQNSVLSITTDIPAGVYGERYIIPAGATGAWTGLDDDIAEYTTTWVYTTPSAGMAAFVEDADAYYVYSSSAWVRMGAVIDHGLLDGLADDDHTQYLLADGSRELSGTLQSTAVSAGTFEGPGYTHASLIDTHNLTTDINHNTITNNHNLTTSIDHDTITNNHDLTTDIDHDAIANYVANKHIDWTNASDNLLTSGNVSAAEFYGDGSSLTGIVVTGGEDHSQLLNLNADDHTHYLLADGTRNMTGSLKLQFANAKIEMIDDGAAQTDIIQGNADFTINIDPTDAIGSSRMVVMIDGGTKFIVIPTGIEVTGDIQGDTFTAGTSAGVTGFFDDGTNFRINVTEGLVTTIGASVSGGYQIG